ncbi:MAG: hypothetical protein U0223_03440 [Nitrospira sp.]|nr:hypothetical protein [Nitrospira sp.]
MLYAGVRQISSYEGSPPLGATSCKAVARQNGAIARNTFWGQLHVEWDPAAAVTPLGQWPFFIEFLNISGLFDAMGVRLPVDRPQHPRVG